MSCCVLCGDRHDFELILPKTAALREKKKLSDKEDLRTCESCSSISDVINEKTVDFQNKNVKKYLNACEKSSPIFDVNNDKIIDFPEKTAKEGLSACDTSSDVDQPDFELFQPNTAFLRKQTD